MIFDVDRQTISDLDIMPIYKDSKSVFTLFNNLATKQSKEVLLNLISNPTSDIELLNERKSAILFIKRENLDFRFNRLQFDFIEYYLELNRAPLRENIVDNFVDIILRKFRPDNAQYVISTGLCHFLELYKASIKLISDLEQPSLPMFLEKLKSQAESFVNLIKDYSGLNKQKKIKSRNINRLDNLIREKKKSFIREYLDGLYKLECFLSIIRSMEVYDLTFAEYSSSKNPKITFKSLFHPFVVDPVRNEFSLNTVENLCFLTGPNMSGKSTFLKSVGLATYLAHIGFPVPAAYMETTVFNGLISTINLPDNINKGFSHYYSEVSRLKETANRLLEKENYVIIFDELFKGTNVKDAFEATYEVVKSLSKIKDCLFLISTHLHEIGERLDIDLNISYKYLGSKIEEGTAIYNYTLQDGVTSERLGLQILETENVFEILNQVIKRQK